MKCPENDRWLDDALTQAIGAEKPETDFEKWQTEHPEAIEMLTSRAQRKSLSFIHPLNIGKIIMNSRITKLAAAAVIIIAVVLSINVWDKSIPTASAAEVLAEAAKAVANLHSVYIKAQIRTIAHDNFALIGVDYDFVPNEMWKEFDGTDYGKWRIEKPGRVVVMDGESTLLLIKTNYAVRGGIISNIGSTWFLQSLLDVHKVLDNEFKLAQQEGSELCLFREKQQDSCEKLIVTIEAKARGDFTNDWLKNKLIATSDNLRIYTFDAETKLLEGLEVYVHTEAEDVLVLQITDIEYNTEIDPALFTIELPDDVIWYKEPEKLDETYAQLGPKEMAIAFFEACAEEDWDEVLKFRPSTEVPKWLKNTYGGLEIISIGEPFKSGIYPGWFVPYEVKLRSGEIRKFNLAVRNDNPAKRYVQDGGI